ncbi:MAG: hypothetical protein M1821_001496 [Bathelium mastoideum]|nr:MAG: hypothetical protein M1821_001496 [Bathelium mastoideum]KAI9690026.1 MAG: hypothetical protein M1822_009908 [Bathelium mastoideum]
MATNPTTSASSVLTNLLSPFSHPVHSVQQPVEAPGSAASSNNTYLMSASPIRNRKRTNDSYKPKIITTVGQRPACLVNASVTYVGNNKIYAFGGFDQYTDEVYNHVLKLDLNVRQWSLVDNYGDIPGVRMGHTANLWQGEKLLVYGGENEHRAYLSDVIIFDLKTATWTQPELSGPTPRGRARHSAVIHDEKLFILGGLTGNENVVLDDICYLDLKTWTWSRTWRFVPRYDHSSWVWEGRIWVFGGIGEDMDRASEIWWLDFRGTQTFENQLVFGTTDRQPQPARYSTIQYPQPTNPPVPPGGYTANSSSVQVNPGHHTSRMTPVAPGSISSLRFVSSPNLPPQTFGYHFHVFTSGCLLDFLTPATVINSSETSLSMLDLDTLRWSRLADGKDLFNPSYRWLYCAMDEDGTHAWLLGCPTEPTRENGNAEEYLSDVLPIDLRKLGLLGNSLTVESRSQHLKMPASDGPNSGHLSGIGADLARTFDQTPESGSGADFVITAERDDADDISEDEGTAMAMAAESHENHTHQRSNTSPPIHVHRLILQARWPHFSRMYNSQMLEFHTKKMHIPEPYSVVRSFLYYLYTDSIAQSTSNPASTDLATGPSLWDVAGMLVMANIYDMPRLRLLCVNRLSRELDVENAARIWERAATAGEDWLKRRAASFCMCYWGRVVRTAGFASLRRRALMELCEEVDADGRVVGGDEVEALGGLGGGRLGWQGQGQREILRKRRAGSNAEGEEVDGDGEDDEGMEIS